MPSSIKYNDFNVKVFQSMFRIWERCSCQALQGIKTKFQSCLFKWTLDHYHFKLARLLLWKKLKIKTICTWKEQLFETPRLACAAIFNRIKDMFSLNFPCNSCKTFKILPNSIRRCWYKTSFIFGRGMKWGHNQEHSICSKF